MSITRSERHGPASPATPAGAAELTGPAGPIDVTGLGEVLVPGDDGYAEASGTLFAAGSPALVARPRDEREVARAVVTAARAGLALSVRSGGHGALGHGTNDGGVVLDLRHLDSVEVVDPGRRVVRVGAGATWGRVAAALAPHGLGLTAGDTASVGVGGLTLGGGVGWMVRRHGLAIDSLVAARVVTADGRTLVASADQHAGLFWALRGGGGNFGVAVSFDFVAQRVGDVRFGSITYSPDDPARLVRGWRDVMRAADEELSSTLLLVPAMFGRPAAATVLVCASHDDGAAADRAIEPLRHLGTVTGSSVATVPYADVLDEGGHPPGVRVVARNVLVPALDDAVVADLVAAFAGERPTVLAVRALGGAFSRVLPDATAFAHRDAEVMVVGGTIVSADASDAAVEDALGGWRAVAAHGTGAYVNFQGSATEADLRAAYPPATLARLRAVKHAYDPRNLFDRNLNVTPGPSGTARAEGTDRAARTDGPAA
ncbi:FAD-binding oxidoreductase [Isoptericola cucumis]|uniref:Oxidoreductase n=1 Tax=Isoptericola cucumis TaxID=1776856 RepID=A0ABQ2B1T8_9MICO|nr:FAD-binding oxidoreductase [Isoptericola cucumis]GGI04478.1 oxidoreductase [Isoptericola cucumis]